MKAFIERVYTHSPDWFQNLALSGYGWKIRRERFGPDYAHWQVVFTRNERCSPIELAAVQDALVEELVAHAYDKVPYYRAILQARKLSPSDVRRVADLPKLPILTKDLVRAHFNELVSTEYRPADLKTGSSSGTTGSPINVLWDRRVEVANNAAHWRLRQWAGFRFGTRYASALGRVVVPIRRTRPPFWRWNAAWKQLLLSSFHLQDENLLSYFDAMTKRGIQFLEAYPSTGYVLARFLLETGRTFPLKAVLTSSETLLQVQRDTIEEAFACRVFDHFGQAERVLVAGECERHDGLHICPEYGVMEIVDGRGEPVPPGANGRIVATGLQNYGMPLIRYDVGDVSAMIGGPCGCGRSLPRMAAVTTKAEDIVVTPEGRFISSSTLTHPFKPMVRIEKSQIVQETPDRVTVKIVRRPGYTDEDTRTLVAGLGERLGPSVAIDVAFVEDIPRGPSGKFRWVVSKVPLRFGEKAQDNLYE